MAVAQHLIARASLFLNRGHCIYWFGGTETNPASGGAGLVSAVSLGSATITANKAGGSQYAAASANYTLNIAPASIAMIAWVGRADTQVGFPA